MKKYYVLFFLFIVFIFPHGIRADLCKTKPINYKIEWCSKIEEGFCYQDMFNIPDDVNNYYLKTTKLSCETGFSEKNGMCIQTSNCDNQFSGTNTVTNVELIDTDNNCEANATNNSTIAISKTVMVSQGCYGTGTYTCTARVSIKSNYNFYFKDYNNTPIKSLVDAKKSTQYAPGTGTTFDVLYNSNLSYSIKYDQEYISYSIGEISESCSTTCTPDPPSDDGGGGGGGGKKKEGGIPKSCSNTVGISASLMGCSTSCSSYCASAGSGTIDCKREIGNITVEAVKADNDAVKINYVNATTSTTKGNDIQYLGTLNDSGTETDQTKNPTNQKYLFTPHDAYINIKNGQILYAGINYNGQNTSLWKKVTPGYYIPINAIPEKVSTVETEIGGTAYIVKANNIEKGIINVKGILSCDFKVKLPGCPYQDCGDMTCNPDTDQFKCCRNTKYLTTNPNYYAKSCNGDIYTYRQISLSEPFPNREAGENWYDWIKEDDNQQDLASGYEKLDYSVHLSNEMISKIREYNRKEGNEYTSWLLMNDNGSSKLLQHTNDLSMDIKKSADNTYYALGCGPSNDSWGWCQ